MAKFKFNSTQIIEFANKKRQMCKEKGWDWSQYYNGFLDGFMTHAIENERLEKQLETASSCTIKSVSGSDVPKKCRKPKDEKCYKVGGGNCEFMDCEHYR